ncbi:Alpha/Beta hydrolase protein [Lipomyces oligophaga]|uniref:Alpha/Beta hydrolase protein n=1 Tax=Lipomyces oligophaga TaxID=45792 RepID=UPI0034CE14BA
MATLSHDKVSLNGLAFSTTLATAPAGVDVRFRCLFIHGFAECIDLYDDYFTHMANLGIEFLSFDQRGAGHTSEQRSDWGVTTEAAIYNDIDAIIEKFVLPKLDDGIPWFFIGFSMGGGISLTYAIKGKHREKFSGYIALAPLILLHPSTQPNAVLYHLLKGVGKIIPKFQYNTGLNVDFVTRDEAIREAIKTHELFHATGTLGQLILMFDRGFKLQKQNFLDGTIEKPILVIHGTGDQINDWRASKKYVENVPVTNKTFVEIPEGYHMLTHDLADVRAKTEDTMIEWMSKNSLSRSSAKL